MARISKVLSGWTIVAAIALLASGPGLGTAMAEAEATATLSGGCGVDACSYGGTGSHRLDVGSGIGWLHMTGHAVPDSCSIPGPTGGFCNTGFDSQQYEKGTCVQVYAVTDGDQGQYDSSLTYNGNCSPGDDTISTIELPEG